MPPSLKTEPSVVINPANGQRLTYGEIAAFGTIPATLPAGRSERAQRTQGFLPDRQLRAAPRQPRSRSTARRNYAIDVKLPGMVYALDASIRPCTTRRPESGIPASRNQSARRAGKTGTTSEIKAMKGVIGIVKTGQWLGSGCRSF